MTSLLQWPVSHFVLLLRKSGESGFIYHLPMVEENWVTDYLEKLSMHRSTGPDRKSSECTEADGWRYCRAAFCLTLKGNDNWERALISRKMNAATIFWKIKNLWEHGPVVSPQPLGRLWSKSLWKLFPGTGRARDSCRRFTKGKLCFPKQTAVLSWDGELWEQGKSRGWC